MGDQLEKILGGGSGDKETITGYMNLDKHLESARGDKWKVGEWKIYPEENGGFTASTSLYDLIKQERFQGNKFVKVEARGKIFKNEGGELVASEMRIIGEMDPKLYVAFAVECVRHALQNRYIGGGSQEVPQKVIKAVEEWLAEPTKRNSRAVTDTVRSDIRSAALPPALSTALYAITSAVEAVNMSAIIDSVRLAVTSARHAVDYAVQSATSDAQSILSAAEYNIQSTKRARDEEAYQREMLERLVRTGKYYI
ncbi:MAG: hypothetical protein QW292_10635 [Candidatus Parvarchaeota archaeon]